MSTLAAARLDIEEYSGAEVWTISFSIFSDSGSSGASDAADGVGDGYAT